MTTVQADRVRTRGEYRVEREPRSSEPARLLRAWIEASEERAKSLRRSLGQQRPEDGN
jgi:hypothetical protein